MSNITTFGKWPLLERLTNDEFLNVLPHLILEEYFLTQIFVANKKWIRLLDASFQTLQAKCGVCNRQVRFEDIKNHLIQNDHLVSLSSNVRQFYHPFYTYGKVDIKLARGEDAPQKVREMALHEVNMQMKSFRKECIFAKKFANIAQRRSIEVEEEHLIETTLAKKIENPDDMTLMVSLPFADIPKLVFSVVSGEWQAAFGYNNFTKKSKFRCNICSGNCAGIESLNSHLNGYSHKLKQLQVLALCCEGSSKVNKNCCIHFGNSLSFSIKECKKIFDSGDSWIKKLPNELSKKVKALNEYVPKIPIYPENSLHQNSVRKDSERVGNFESYENLGHLGVEYVLKIIKNKNDPDPRFECGLCEFVGDGMKMQRHLLMYGHKKKYLDLHYSDTIKKYEDSIGHMSYKEFRAVMSQIVLKVAVEIEKHHSRSLPYTVSLSDYKARRPDLIAEVYAVLHASQNRGPSFSNVLSKTDIRKLKNSATGLVDSKVNEDTNYILFTTAPKGKVYISQMSHDPVVRLREYNSKFNKIRTLRTSRSISPTQNQVSDLTRRGESRSHRWVHEQRSRSESPMYERTRSPMQRPQGIVNQNIWDIYRHEIALAANDIEVSYENYRKNPESHPLYEEEWNNFWQHRKKELEREGCDYRSYNFQPEWVHYFKQRIEVLFGEALHNSKINIRHRLEIPLDAEEDCQRSHESANQHIADCLMKDNSTFSKDIDGLKGRKRRNSADYKGCAPLNKKVFAEQMQGQRKENLSINQPQLIISKIRDNHSNVIHVLRLMTALEEHLGSLGGKVMDLLSNALQLEKSYSGNNVEFESKVLTIDNCHLLETAMEKLKGILFAGLLDEKKISGFNRVVQHTANLLKYAEKMGWRHENNVNESKVFHNNDRGRAIQDAMYVPQNINVGGVSQMHAEKTLSDALKDLVTTSQTSKKQIEIAKEQFGRYTKEHLNLPDCPPPPNIREANINTDLFASYTGLQSNSGLASFDTKLSLDEVQPSQKLRRDLSELRKLHRNKISGGGNLNNSSLKNNNDTRTNTNTRTNIGLGIGGSMNNNSGTSSHFRNYQIIPNMGQNNAMYQGGGGGNRNQNWLQWNYIN